MVRGKIIQENEKIQNFNTSDSTEIHNNDDITLPRGGPKKNIGLSSSKSEDEQKIFTMQSTDEQQQQIQPKRGRGRPRKNPIATITNFNDIDQNLSISNSESSSSSKIILNHHEELHEVDVNENLNDSNDDQQNIISVIEIVDDSQDNSIINNLEYSYESQNNQNNDNILEQDDENSQELQSDSNAIIIEEIIDKSRNFENDDDDELDIEIVKKKSENFNIEAKINSESIITISSDDSNYRSELKLNDASISDLNERSYGGDTVSSPDILHVHINPNSARTYQNKRKSKTHNDTNTPLHYLSNNISKLDNKNIIELNHYNQNQILNMEENNIDNKNDNTLNSNECRRSSRKKTMKYDVRDLLNKNRKKIQIEARIDSLPKKINDDSTITTMENELKNITESYCNNLSPLIVIPKIELNDISIRKPEPPQLNSIHLLNDKSQSQTIITNKANSPQKNLIQIQSKNTFDCLNHLPPPPPLKSIVELEKKVVSIPNGLYSNEQNTNSKIYSFQDAFNAGIFKNYDNKIVSAAENVDIASSTVLFTPQSILPSTTTIVPPVLSSMVKSPLLNIKFKHQNLAIRKSFDSLINANFLPNNLNENKSTIKEIQPQSNNDDLRIDSGLVTESIEEKIVKVKGKRGRPPKNKLLPQANDNIPIIIKQITVENTTENNCLTENPILQKKKIISSLNSPEKLSSDNSLKGKHSNEISTITKNINLSPTNSAYSNTLANFKFMETKVKIKRLSYRSSVDSIDNNINNKNNHFTDGKNNESIKKSEENKKNNLENPIKIMQHEIELNSYAQDQNTEKQNVANIKLDDHDEYSEEMESKKEKHKLIMNKPTEEKSTESASPKNKQHCEYENTEKLEKSTKNFKEMFKPHPSFKKKEKDVLNKESNISDYNTCYNDDNLKQQKLFDKNLNKEEILLSNKTKDQPGQNDRKIILPKSKLFLETENSHELKLQKLDRKKTLQNKIHIEKTSMKKLKKIAIEDKNLEQIKSFEEEKETPILTDIIKNFYKPQEEFTNLNTINYSKNSGEPEDIENKIVSNKLESIAETLPEKIASEINSEIIIENANECEKQRESHIFEEIAEKLIENDISLQNVTENIQIHNAEQNVVNLNQIKENISTNIKISDRNETDDLNNKINNSPTEIIEKSENTIQEETTINLKNTEVSSDELLQEELTIKNENIISKDNEKTVLPDDNKLNLMTKTISVSSSTDSSDPLKDIEKFLEAAGNLLSRSTSSEDENDTTRRCVRSATRFKDANSKDEDCNENHDNLCDVASLQQQDFDKTILENSTSQIDKFDCNISKLNMQEDIKKTDNVESTKSTTIFKPNLNENCSAEYVSISIKELSTDTDTNLNFSHKFPSEEISKISCNIPQPISKRTAGPRTPPFPPPSDLQIPEQISLLQSPSKCEESLLNLENDSTTITSSLDFHSDSMNSNSSIILTDSKCLITKSSKKDDDDLKLIKKLKRKDEKKLKKKDGITNELKRTIKEMKKMKKFSSDGNLVQGTLSKAAVKSYSPVNLVDCKTDGDSQSLDDSIGMDENQSIYYENNKNIRRSHRIKTITKSQSVGRGLVRDKDFDDIKPDLAVIDAQNAKFLKDMEERLSQFRVIRDNEYKCERIISKEAKKMICDCFMTREEEDRGEFGCGEDCLNRLLMIECGPKCTVSDRCTNRRFQRALYAPCKVFQTEKKGCGIMADAEIACGQFIMEYVGEVLNSSQFEKRAEMYSQDKNKHYYFMALRSDAIIDATTRGNISRFINHSCDPNAETQKWTVNGELRIGFFTTRTVLSGEEITFDYQFQRYGKEAQRCYCESSSCRGWIGEEPDDSDEEELEDESEDDEKIKTGIKKDISQKIIKDICNDQLLKTKLSQEISLKTDADDKENIDLIKTKPKDEKEKKTRGRKKRLDFRLGKKNYEFIDDPDLDDEVLRLLESGLKNQVQTLCLSRLIVRAKQLETRLNLLQILRKGEMSCRRLFLDYHGLKLLHGWMSETTELVKDTDNDLQIRLNLLETLECLPIPNKTMLKDSKVFQTVQNWSQDKTSTESSPNDGSPNENSNSSLITSVANVASDFTNNNAEKPTLLNTNENINAENPIKTKIKIISTKLITIWDGLPEVFRIPRKERVEQMKEHEREADRQYVALKLVDDESEIRRNRGRFTKDIKINSSFSNNTDLTPNSGGSIGKYKWSRDIKSEAIKERRKEFEKYGHQDGLSKLQRRQIFAAKVAQDEAEKRLADDKREFDIKSKFYGLDSLTTHPRNFPFCVNPATGQWYTIDRRKIPTPPSHAHIKVPPKPQSTNHEDYYLPPMDLPPFWKFAIDPHKGRIYYYHMKIRIPQWEPPIKILPLNDGTTKSDASTCQAISNNITDVQNDENDSSDSGSESSDSVNDKNKDTTLVDGKPVQPLTSEQKKIEKKKRRYALLVQERPISPRREEDRVYNQIEMRRYKENKEKIRRRKEEIKRRKIQLARQLTDQQSNSETENNNDINEESISTDANIESDSSISITSSDSTGVEPLPIADYLLSSDEEETITNFCDANLIEKIVKGEKIVDELDALNINRPLKRLLSFKDKNSSGSTTITVNNVEHKSKKSKTDEKKLKSDDEIKKPKSSSKLNNPKYLARKAKEKFRTDIAGIIVLHLTPYRKETCKTGRITKNEDFKHLARKLTHFVLVKELKHCDLTGQQLIVTDSVINKSREFIKKYMAKYGEIYIRPENDPEFKEIPH